ncbi:hypothetical protein DEU56DRAFT_776736 [Suillus clintonianus]|uniref:uncharacterized protein n=1 Tax=Suillus clintonianus TaxID=1904413 RepID=UPI001B86BD35|nr:uncharacterized protein DEU56DRAFT_776736 [Suillus clintonianus]KAG2152895.1 hypothetical protein DEU56DRAFT_776736 [Suillus clintonianus]
MDAHAARLTGLIIGWYLPQCHDSCHRPVFLRPSSLDWCVALGGCHKRLLISRPVSDMNWKLVGSVLVTTLGQYAIMVTTARTRSAASFFTCPFEIPYAAASAICDVMISVSFLFYLRPARSGIKRTNNHMQ